MEQLNATQVNPWQLIERLWEHSRRLDCGNLEFFSVLNSYEFNIYNLFLTSQAMNVNIFFNIINIIINTNNFFVYLFPNSVILTLRSA